ncbi:MAG: hypothetical protein M3Y54_11895 [Bacteroidota bacterium]|nr:hypothetical protein [Bacteroidota bacterium]
MASGALRAVRHDKRPELRKTAASFCTPAAPVLFAGPSSIAKTPISAQRWGFLLSANPTSHVSQLAVAGTVRGSKPASISHSGIYTCK